MTQPIDRVSIALISELGIWAGRSLVLATAAAAGLTAFRARNTPVRLFTWSFVLYASIAMPVLVWLLPPLPVPTPNFFLQRVVTQAHSSANSRHVLSLERKTATNGRGYGSAVSAADPTDGGFLVSGPAETRSNTVWANVLVSLPWESIAAGIYLLITIYSLIRFIAGIVLSRKLVRNARPITEPAARMKLPCQSLSVRLGMSDWVSVPLTVGILRPTILLPSDWHTWDDAKLDAVLAHELSHVTRHDAFTQRVAMLYRTIFWFNPLAWWLHRHLAALAEQASDEAALSGGVDQGQYARTLLGFFEKLQGAPGRIRWEGVSMARHGQAEQRLERILAWKGTVTMNLKKSLAVAIFVLAMPVIYLAASLRPPSVAFAAQPGMGAQSVPPSPALAPVAGVATPAPVGGIASAGPVTTVAPTAAVAAVAPAWGGVGQNYSFGGSSYHYGFDDEDRFVIVSGKTDAVTMSGSTQDAHHAEKLKKQISGNFIWFQRDEKSYIIRDQATVDRARNLWAPQEELGKKQEALGKQQEELGKQQEELGNKMEQVRVKVPDMTAALDKLRAELQKLGPTATMEQIGDLQSEIGELQSRIGEIQSQAGEQQSKVGELQGQLGEKQGKLGEQQGELGRQQAELAEKATRQMKELLDDALKNGLAKPEPQTGDGPML